MWDLSLGRSFVGIGPEVFFSSPSLLLPSSFGSAYLWKKGVVHLKNFGLKKQVGSFAFLWAYLHYYTFIPLSLLLLTNLVILYQEQHKSRCLQWKVWTEVCTNVSRGETRKILKKLQHLVKLSDPEKKIRWHVKVYKTPEKKITGRQAADQQSGWVLVLASSFHASTCNHCHSSS